MPSRETRPRDAFRNYAAAEDRVRATYAENHARQTLDFVLAKKRDYGRLDRARMTVWEAIARLDQIVDDSDPDTSLSQLEHALQTAEAIRRDGHPDWFVLTGLIHDLGKVLCLWGEPQWAVVGDTFPVGCAFSDKIVYPELLAANPDASDPRLATRCGIYHEGCGLDALHLAWGHDEYLYQVVKDRLPPPALWMIRYHSCYPIHREGAYAWALRPRDQETLRWVRAFNPYDLYSKSADPVPFARVRPYYEDLVQRFLPDALLW